jgi:molybdopterin/thiamine biosynthesis adenylyltransferase
MSDRDDDGLDDTQLLRYSRHLLLDDIGIEGQRRLRRAHALVIGAGGLGSPVVLYLGSAGVGTLTIVDDDRVDLTNLQRQIAHDLARVGQPKAASAARSVQALNPDVRVVALQERADAVRLDALVRAADVVLDCSDNFATRQAVNAACVAHAKPLVAGAAIGFDGQVSVYDSRGHAGSHAASSAAAAAAGIGIGVEPEDDADAAAAAATLPCYACVFRPDAPVEDVRCATMGVFAPLVGIIGSLQAAEALKLLLGIGPTLAGRLQMLDARRMEWSEIAVRRDAACPVCGNGPTGPAPARS